LDSYGVNLSCNVVIIIIIMIMIMIMIIIIIMMIMVYLTDPQGGFSLLNYIIFAIKTNCISYN